MNTVSDLGIHSSIELRARQKADNSRDLLSHPHRYENGFRKIDEKHLEECLEKNFSLKQNSSRRDRNIRNIAITELRALINSLSDTDKQKLSEIVFSIENDKKHIKNFKGITFSGGELRVIPEVAAGMIINVIAMLSGLKNADSSFGSFFGTSAGALPAASMALNCANSQMFRVSTETKYEDFQGNRTAYKNWIKAFLRRGYEFNTGKSTVSVKLSDLEEIRESGTTFDVVAARKTKDGNESFYLLSELEKKYGVNPSHFELAEAAAISANLPFLFHSPFDKTFGNCFIKDLNGNHEYLYDGGLVPGGLIPFDHIREQFADFRLKRVAELPFYFIVGNRKVENKEIVLYKELGGKHKKTKDFRPVSMRIACMLNEFMDRFQPNQKDEIKKLGLNRALIEVSCITVNPENNEIVFLRTGELKVDEKTKKLVSCSNIPTTDFTKIELEKGDDFPYGSVIDQLHSNLVDPEYVNSRGKYGKSAYELYLTDINNTTPKIEEATPYSAKKLLLDKAASL